MRIRDTAYGQYTGQLSQVKSPFSPTSQEAVDEGFQDFARRWLPILDTFQACNVRFALEVHPTEIAYDIFTMQRALAAVNYHPSFGINFDPSHLVHQFVNPLIFFGRVC